MITWIGNTVTFISFTHFNYTDSFNGKLLRLITILIVYRVFGLFFKCYKEFLRLCLFNCGSIKVSAKNRWNAQKIVKITLLVKITAMKAMLLYKIDLKGNFIENKNFECFKIIVHDQNNNEEAQKN